ncbi:hypothetical protein MJD09_10935 [bacterium]|nr:hypothetical protein [bacterium]
MEERRCFQKTNNLLASQVDPVGNPFKSIAESWHPNSSRSISKTMIGVRVTDDVKVLAAIIYQVLQNPDAQRNRDAAIF